MTKISVIIPVFNVEKFLPKCLDSLVNQTLRDIEIICVNDGSTDNSLNILREYEKTDTRFKIITQENQGQGIARNKAINVAKGEYTVFVDPDDWIELDALEKIYKHFKKTNADVIQFNYKKFSEQFSNYENINLQEKLIKNYHYDISKTGKFNCINLGKNCLSAIGFALWSRAYSTSYIKSNNIKCTPYKYGEDQIFTLMAILCTKNIYYLNEYLYIYRVRVGSTVNKISIGNFCVFENIKLFKDFLINKNLYNILETEYREYMQNVLVWHYKVMPKENQKEYKIKASKILTPTEYNIFLKKIKNNNSFFENIFSIKNKQVQGLKYKYFTIMEFEFKFCKK